MLFRFRANEVEGGKLHSCSDGTWKKGKLNLGFFFKHSQEEAAKQDEEKKRKKSKPSTNTWATTNQQKMNKNKIKKKRRWEEKKCIQVRSGCVYGWQQMGLACSDFFSFFSFEWLKMDHVGKGRALSEYVARHHTLYSAEKTNSRMELFPTHMYTKKHTHTVQTSVLIVHSTASTDERCEERKYLAKCYMHIWMSPRFTFLKVIRWICTSLLLFLLSFSPRRFIFS